MSNPTPILNNINAFDATKGTTISFNIIGGTDIVRSNIVYIYDLSTNDLICTHLYISTESIHELPPNTDPSIVYASGKSSADFVNNKNYYLQIQTFTNTAGTAGGSGMSVAKTFWCLFNPALSVNTIPAAISTTSYNVGATYTTNITDATIPVTNIIQQYKFDLYTATGTLVQTSGNIIGSGEQEGTSTTYNITYNFSGLVVNNSYYVVVTTTSTEGMTVSAQSNTFTVSIDTPTVGGAIVNNNACDGYISVVSNLSDEYGGSASGEMASFETDSVNNVSSLKVNMEPIQDLHGYDHPWVGGAGKNKCSVSELTDIGWASANDEIKSVLNSLPSGTYTFSFDLVLTEATKTGEWQYGAFFGRPTKNVAKWNNVSADPSVGYNASFFFTFTISTEEVGTFTSAYIYGCGSNGQGTMGKATISNLQLESGSSKTAFAPYENICQISGRTEVVTHRTGKNLLNSLYRTYTLQNNVRYYRNGGGGLKLFKGVTYTLSVDESNTRPNGIYMNVYNPTSSVHTTLALKYNAYSVSFTPTEDVVIETDCYYATAPTEGIENIKVQLEVGSATAYEPYEGDTYTTPLGRTVYGGTLDLVTGVLTVTHVFKEFNGSNNVNPWKKSGSALNGFYTDMVTNMGELKMYVGAGSTGHPVVSDKFKYTDSVQTYFQNYGYVYTDYTIGFNIDPALAGNTVDSFKAYLADNPIQVVYKLATPQTYQLTPHQIQTLVGQNNVWSDAGDVEVTFNLPISNLLVKRQDASDVSGDWLTLYSQPITQASDMDFTFIDFLNQYGKTYRYALVPLLTQQQGDIDVEIEGGYTVSDDVLSVFDGVFIANNNGSQKLKAATEYGDLETNQDVGVLTTIGGKYPFVVSNSNLNYHSGSISALIVPSDFYTSGDLDRLSIVERREAIEKFLTDKTAKILKDWNGNIWLITFVENVVVSFVDDYGMGLGTLSAKWVEIGDVNDQTDLQQTGLI